MNFPDATAKKNSLLAFVGYGSAPATCTVNANVGYRTPRWELALECVNLLNRKDNDIEYYYTSMLDGEVGGVDDIHFHPAEPRMFRGRLTYKW